MYGGTGARQRQRSAVRGLSPRVRGNLFGAGWSGPYDRSIPACTGEPTRKKDIAPLSRVYPRVYGGTTLGLGCRLSVRGLSPRVRGNRCPACPVTPVSRSIPACTGEPRMGVLLGKCAWVYPRVYGGTTDPPRYPRLTLGLSPRVRGNHMMARRGGYKARSIPACTGEPSATASQWSRTPVYPRVYGGTTLDAFNHLLLTGLSPRVRGNRRLGMAAIRC